MRARLEELRKKDPRATLAQVWVPYERISPQLKRAVVAAEDAKFLAHEGFDWEGIQAAYEKNARRGRIVAGGSTISQQLAKNLFLSRARTPWRKGEEALITVMLEAALDKRRILELYLNLIEWGERTFGAEAAARRHFGTGAADARRRAGGAPGGDGPEPPLLRAARHDAVSRAPDRGHPRAHGAGAGAVSGPPKRTLAARRDPAGMNRLRPTRPLARHRPPWPAG